MRGGTKFAVPHRSDAHPDHAPSVVYVGAMSSAAHASFFFYFFYAVCGPEARDHVILAILLDVGDSVYNCTFSLGLCMFLFACVSIVVDPPVSTTMRCSQSGLHRSFASSCFSPRGGTGRSSAHVLG